MACEFAGVGSKCGSAPCSFTATTGPSGASMPSSRNRDRMNSATSYSVGRASILFADVLKGVLNDGVQPARRFAVGVQVCRAPSLRGVLHRVRRRDDLDSQSPHHLHRARVHPRHARQRTRPASIPWRRPAHHAGDHAAGPASATGSPTAAFRAQARRSAPGRRTTPAASARLTRAPTASKAASRSQSRRSYRQRWGSSPDSRTAATRRSLPTTGAPGRCGVWPGEGWVEVIGEGDGCVWNSVH